MRPGDTPVPIPNTKVKAWPADGTALETVWESRWPPNQKKNNKGRFAASVYIFYIDTDTDRLQPVSVNPISRAVLL